MINVSDTVLHEGNSCSSNSSIALKNHSNMSKNNGKHQANKLYLKVNPHCTVEVLKRHNHYRLTVQTKLHSQISSG